MIRWSYVAPRVLIVVAVALAIRYGLDPLLQRTMISLGERALSAKVEIGGLETSLGSTELSLRDVALANPSKPMQNLFEAREIKLALDREALLHRKIDVREARVSGLRVDTDRETSGALDKPGDEVSPKPPRPHDRRLEEAVEKWLDQWADVLEGRIAEEVEKLESVRLARELSVRWPAEYDQMDARADSLKRRAEALRDSCRTTNAKDLLRNPDAIRQTLADVEAIQQDMLRFRGEIDRLREQVLQDRLAIEQARQNDIDSIRSRLRLDELQGEGLSQFLLSSEFAERVQTTIHWIQWAYRHNPWAVEPAKPERLRGIDVEFAQPKPRPAFLLQKLVLDGEGTMDGRRFTYSGQVETISSDPVLTGKPTVVKLDVRGEAAMLVEAVFDRTQAAPYDRITIECPEFPQPRRVWGRPDRLALAVSPGNTRLSVILHREGELYHGRIRLRQESIELKPSVGGRFGGEVLAADLQEILRRIQAVEVTADLDGPLDDLDWRLRTDLGTQLADAANWLVQREIEARRHDLAVYVQRQIDEELARFEQRFQAKQQAVLAKLDLSAEEIRLLRQLVAERIPNLPAADKLLGKPLDLPLRF